MTVVIHAHNSPSVDDAAESPGGERRYHVLDALSEETALAAVKLVAPAIWLKMYRQKVHVEPNAEGALNCWSASVSYGKDQPKEPGYSKRSFNTTGGAQKITAAIANKGRYTKAGDQPHDHKGAVNVQADGSVEGVEVIVPKAELSITQVFVPEDVTDEYLDQVHEMTGTINAAQFGNYQPGEALFLGAEFAPASLETVEGTFKFAIEKNRQNKAIGAINGINKRGQDYLWIDFEQEIDDGAKRLGPVPRQVNVDQVYEESDFSVLNLVL